MSRGRPGRGRIIAIVGPDGTGKSTLADGLVGGLLADRPTRLVANRRGAQALGVLPHRKVRGPTTEPHRDPPYPLAVSVGKALYVFANFVLGWSIRVRPFVRRGGWVVMERGWWDTTVDPTRYRLRPTPGLARLLGQVVPRPDLVLILDAPAEAIRARKAQLSVEEIDRQRRAWRATLPASQPRLYLDASLPAAEVLRRAGRELTRLGGAAGIGPGQRLGGRARSIDGTVRSPDDGPAADQDVSALWMPLLRRLTDICPGWVIWKNADVALSGEGDVDVVAPPSEWEAIAREFRVWAEVRNLHPVLECRHVPGSMFLMAADPQRQALHQLDVKAGGTHRGSTLFRPEDLASLSRIDERGFRRLRPGAEGLFKLALNGVKRNGSPRIERIQRERIPELLASDPSGVLEASRVFGRAQSAMRAGAERAARDEWAGGAMLAVEGWAHLRAIGEPGYVVKKAWFRLVGNRRCPGLKAMVNSGLLAPVDPKAWPTQVFEAHASATRARGGVIMIAGPDGAGKTTLSEALGRGVLTHVPVRRIHHARGLGVLPHRKFAPGSSTEPHRRAAYPPLVSVAKWLYLFFDFQIGWALRLGPFVRRGGWVLMQRTWWDLLVDPLRYRLRPAPRLVRLLGRLMPRPDLIIVLEGPPQVIAARKSELSVDELDRQMGAWRDVVEEASLSGEGVVYVDASQPPAEVARKAAEQVKRLLAPRSVSPPAGGWANLPGRRSPRWILPRGPASMSRGGLRVYHPVTLTGWAGWELTRFLAPLGALRLLPRGGPPPEPVLHLLAPHVPSGGSIAVARTNHHGRYVAVILDERGRSRSVAKLATDDSGREALGAEARNLRALGGFLPPPLAAPRVLGEEPCLLLLEPIPWTPRLRCWHIPEDVAFALGRFFRAAAGSSGEPVGATHGDFAPWNLVRSDSRWVLLDWEHARSAGPSFHDPLHFLFQSHDLLGRPRRRALLDGIHGRGPVGRAILAYARGAGLDPLGAKSSFATYLELRLAQLDPSTAGGRKDMRTLRSLLRNLTLRAA